MLFKSSGDEAASGQVMEGLKMISPSLVAHPDPPELAEAGQRAFDDIAMLSQTAAMRVAAARSQETVDADCHQDKSNHRHRAVGAVAVDRAGLLTRSSQWSLNRRHRLEQRWQLILIRQVGRRRLHHQWNSGSIGQHMTFAAGFCPIYRVGSAVRAPLNTTALALLKILPPLVR
jgi:hypothetical protein